MKNFKIPGKIVAIILLAILVAIGIIKVPYFVNTNKLRDMGYTDEQISCIYDKKLTNTILNNNYYSEYLAREITKDSFNEKYIKLYTITDYLDDTYFELYEKLKTDKGYTDEELETLYANLNYVFLRPLLIFDKLEDLDTYIEDSKKHSDNTLSYYKFSNDYLHKYQNLTEIEDKSSIEAFVSVKTTLGEYEPEKMVEIPSMHAISGLKLQSVALDAFTKLCNALRENDSAIYAVSAYKDYAYYDELYQSVSGRYGYKGDDYVFSQVVYPGCGDAQTGLSVEVVASENESVDHFTETKAYAWLVEHAYEYGFIFRYPEGKEELTGMSAKYNYLRYVGVDLATKLHDTNMCFEEYYYMYIK